MDFELSEDETIKSIGELKGEFYDFHTVKKKEKKKGFENVPLVLRPLALILNPPALRSINDTINPDFYIAVYNHKFFVRVECGKSIMEGPHKMELCMQVRMGYVIKLGCWSSIFSFYNERMLRKKLKKAILKRKYFCSELTAEQVIEFGDNGELSITL